MAIKLTSHPYIKKPLIFALSAASTTSVLAIFFSCYEVHKILESVNEATTNFSLSFIAFSVTALALLSLAQNQQFFDRVAQSTFFHSFVGRFIFSTKFAIVLLLASFGIRFIDPLYTKWIGIALLALLVGALTFVCVWVWRCIDDLVDLFKA